MHSVKLTVFIEDHADLDMEVRVVTPEHDVAAIKPCIVPVTSPNDDDYVLGGYAGI